MILNDYSCFPHISFDLNVFLFQEDFTCIETRSITAAFRYKTGKNTKESEKG